MPFDGAGGKEEHLDIHASDTHPHSTPAGPSPFPVLSPPYRWCTCVLCPPPSSFLSSCDSSSWCLLFFVRFFLRVASRQPVESGSWPNISEATARRDDNSPLVTSLRGAHCERSEPLLVLSRDGAREADRRHSSHWNPVGELWSLGTANPPK